MITEEEIQSEKEYLSKVLNVLTEEIESYDQKVKALSSNIQEQMSYAWDKTNRLSDTEFVYALANIQKRSVYAENANKKVRSYKKMLNNAYFARIDFDDGEEILPVYIGICSLQQGDEFYVYDWRAPISSMFYNNEIGDAGYTISTGEKISGKITLKRQYKISGGEIKEIFDTDMQIIDNVLKQILSTNATNKMKNIVNTIQKEQNEIIRKNNYDILVVQGPAGSGKTSIAMHKIAYLLYSERDKINNSNIMILSPNEIFNNYISDVLPDIGEDNVCEATFMEFAKAYISEYSISSSIEDVYEVVYSNEKNSDKYNEIKFKTSSFYYKIIDNYLDENKVDLLGLEPVIIGEDTEIVSMDEIKKIAKQFKTNNESLYSNGKKIIERIFYVASTRSKKQLTLEKLKKQALENLVKVKLKIATTYENIFSDLNEFKALAERTIEKYFLTKTISDEVYENVFNQTKFSISKGELEYQDITPFMYLKSKIIGIGANKNIKYVLIDEAQDYSVQQYKIISLLFKNSVITLLGDLNQSILPFNNIKDYSKIIKALSRNKQNPFVSECEITKTYRSTFEINEYAKKVILNNNYNQIDRHGDPVIIKKQNSFDPQEIINRAIELKKSYNTVAIICKNSEEILLYNQVILDSQNSNSFRVVSKDDKVFVQDKIMLIPSYLSKGLEFDAVIISNASEQNYCEDERNLFYVVLTRALHKLEIFYTGNYTSLIPEDTNEKGE